MSPNDEREKFILNFLYDRNEDNDFIKVFKGLFERGKSQFGCAQLESSLEEMDQQHQNLLNIVLMGQTGYHDPINRIRQVKTFLVTSAGEKRLDELNNPKSDELMQSFNFNGPVSNNGQTSFGNNNVFSDDHSSTFNINNSINQLLQIKDDLPDKHDQRQLEEFANALKELYENENKDFSHPLSKFKNFLNRTWATVSPAVAPLLVELAKKTFF
jgi:hemerythrin